MLQRIDLTKVTKLCVGGTWFDIEPGSLATMPGVMSTFAGSIQPMLAFRRGGEDAAIISDAVAAISPVELIDPDEQPLGASHGMSAVRT